MSSFPRPGLRSEERFVVPGTLRLYFKESECVIRDVDIGYDEETKLATASKGDYIIAVLAVESRHKNIYCGQRSMIPMRWVFEENRNG